jgi:cobalt-zinc-cadmium efflux system outer membrane protein
MAGAAQPPDLSRDTVLDQRRLTCAVLASNPELAAWHDAWRAASARADQPTSLGETSLSYSFAPASIGSSAVGYGQLVQIEQSFRLGQTSLERRVARAQAEAARHDVAAKRQELALVATTLFDEYYTLTRALETNAEHKGLVDSILDTATARYSTGAASQQDPIQAELEVAHIEHERIVLLAQRDVVKAQINGLLHRPPDTPLPPPPDRISVDLADAADPEQRRPETEAAIAQEDAAEQATALARRRFSPSVKAMGSYNSMWPMVEHRFMVGAGISIPIQLRSLRAGIAEAKAERSAARHHREAIEDAVAVEQAAARHELEEANHVVELHRNRLIPTARARIEAAHVGYETGANDFSTVIEAERELRSLELAYHRALANLNDERAELDYALGRSLDCDGKGTDR